MRPQVTGASTTRLSPGRLPREIRSARDTLVGRPAAAGPIAKPEDLRGFRRDSKRRLSAISVAPHVPRGEPLGCPSPYREGRCGREPSLGRRKGQ